MSHGKGGDSVLTPRRHGIQMETEYRERTTWGWEPQDVGGFHMLEKKGA